ncbi:putative membrane protein [Clostridium argentinense CDC 2741]|uniref:Putative membrane protein n=1 Tax=Clostridium argentinense CDC 2741 TaxID=1418104 RepID=A0A0C1U3E8_9CLOT|nr:putative membrane protein [Clostridium argentinense CDC 2741]
MKKQLALIFQAATVFVGTIVGAGLASGQEITQFFTTYGYKSFIGLLICAIFYIFVSSMIVSISLRYNLNSYTELINLVSPGFLGKITDILTSFFLVAGAAIILAGGGALLKQYFGLPKYIGIILMAIVSLITLLRDTKGLIAINSFIVPSLSTIVIAVFTLYLIYYRDNMSLEFMKTVPVHKNMIIPYQWIISSFLYAGFNMLSCSGVLVPVSKEMKNKSMIILGLILGSLLLTLLGFLINSMLLVNIPDIFKYEIPLLHVASKFGPLMQVLLLLVIWCEMFSTEVSDIYSVGKTLEQKFNIPYKKAVVIILFIALPVSQIGFKNLITYLYPGFGIISLIFVVQTFIFYMKKCRK